MVNYDRSDDKDKTIFSCNKSTEDSLFNADDDDFESQYEKPLTIDLNAIDEEDIVDLKKKKVKRNVYYDKKTRRSFTKKGFGGSTVLEEFSVLKVYEDPLPYVRDIYWFDFRKRKIIKSRNFLKILS